MLQNPGEATVSGGLSVWQHVSPPCVSLSLPRRSVSSVCLSTAICVRARVCWPSRDPVHFHEIDVYFEETYYFVVYIQLFFVFVLIFFIVPHFCYVIVDGVYLFRARLVLCVCTFISVYVYMFV